MLTVWKKLDSTTKYHQLEHTEFENGRFGISWNMMLFASDIFTKIKPLPLILQLFLCPPLCCRFVMCEHNSWVNFLFASVRVICGRELCPVSSSRPGARGHYMLGFSGNRDLLNFAPGEGVQRFLA